MSKKDLEPLIGRTVQAKGKFSGSTYRSKPGSARTNRIATLMNVTVQAEHRRIVVGHCHVQYADDILHEKPKIGETVEFTAEVTEYTKKNSSGPTISWGLSNPFDVSLAPVRVRYARIAMPRAVAPEAEPGRSTPQPEQQPVQACPPSVEKDDLLDLESLRRVKAVGVNTIKAVLELQEDLGNEQLKEILEMFA